MPNYYGYLRVSTEGQEVESQKLGLLEYANQRVGKSQRLADLRIVDQLPRSQIGKILKRELRASYEEDSA